MHTRAEVKDILLLAFLKEGLSIRNRDLVECQKQVAATLLARRHDIVSRKRAYRAFILLEKAISDDYRQPTFIYGQALQCGRVYLDQNSADLKYGMRYRHISHKVFHYLKSRLFRGKTRS